MSAWSNSTLGDLCHKITDGAHHSPKEDENGLPMFSVKDMKEQGFDYSKPKRISNGDFNKLIASGCQPSIGDILIAKDGSVMKHVFSVNSKPDYVLLSSIAIVKPDSNKIDSKFLVYAIKSPDITDTILNNYVSGSGVPRIVLKDFKKVEISYPSLNDQKTIASVLCSLDDKIDLLHRQNTTLERMAETLFRQWFVEEAQEDWDFVELGDYVDCFNGVSYKSSELNPSKVAMVTLKSFDRNGGFRLDGFKEFTGRFKEQHIVVQSDLVVAHTDITQDAEVIGNPVLVVNDTRYENMVISMDLVKVKSKFDWLSNEFLYRMMRTREFKEHCLGYSNGSTVLHLSKQAIPSFEFFMPTKEKIQSYTEIAKGLFGKKFKNIEQIKTLEKLRDNLLPKLMSGEVRVIVGADCIRPDATRPDAMGAHHAGACNAPLRGVVNVDVLQQGRMQCAPTDNA